jgi:hypothetical protein
MPPSVESSIIIHLIIPGMLVESVWLQVTGNTINRNLDGSEKVSSRMHVSFYFSNPPSFACSSPCHDCTIGILHALHLYSMQEERGQMAEGFTRSVSS